MQYRAIIRIVGLLISLFSVTMVPPILVSLIFKDGGGLPFFLAFLFNLFIGFMLWFPNRYSRAELKAREGFLIVVLFWTVLGSVGAVPLMLTETPSISHTDAFFESFSGLTTTGATILTNLETLPKAVLFYRQQLQWLGGMGIIVLAVAILPILGVGGMQLYRAEAPGPVKDSKMTPRIADTAKHLWYIYVSLTLACAAAYWAAGMNLFDAICHSFSTIAIGGFSTYDASIGHFDSSLINLICVVFLLISGANFALHYTAWRAKSIYHYLSDPEFKGFLFFQLVIVAVCFFVLVHGKVYENPNSALDHALFQAVSMGTTAGFATTGFHDWPIFLPILLIFASFIGGCAGSTGGGMKVVRVLILHLQGMRELKRLVHPKAIISIKLGSRPLSERVIEAIWGFFSAYTLVFIFCMLLLIATGMDDLTAFSAVAACLNNLGPGLGEVASHYGEIPDSSKWVLIIAMLFGRLEIFTLLVIFTPAFWRN
ncbi:MULTISPECIES: TrkH family potassium uptake protein [Corallincola]|uniref:Trk system potassium uptake protein n=3 Tax=Corallincola TaxID=1775176 RepID=A0A368N5F4_9GAMM|nr:MULTISPECIES: TrkH family potassium uptake protein [Corallincola]RCU45390.1 potassium transporter [Corallincola holothuriorum]TAA41101.1 potassium transporter [Corallincola spongiicola]TCI02752.1 potassium transporter [Corallincola luteus]